VPKITAPTVAEHRAAQRAMLLHAGRDLLASGGLAALSATSVTERAGIARSSFYDYFPSKEDLLVAIAIDAMERWDDEIEEALQGIDNGLDKLRAFVDATMRMTTEGKHAIAGMLREAELSPTNEKDVMALHEALFRPVVQVLTGLGMDASYTSIMLIQGVLGAGVQLVTHGVDQGSVADDVFAMLTRGLIA